MAESIAILATVVDRVKPRAFHDLAGAGADDRIRAENRTSVRGGGGVIPSPELPALHRLTILYLMLPLIIWLLGWFEWWFGVPAAALLVAGLWKAMSGPWRLALSSRVLTALPLALGFVMLTAAGGVFELDNWDWYKHRAIFTDLATSGWPVYLRDYFAEYASSQDRGPDPLLRYYLGYYMVPGLVAKLFGLASLNWAVPLWTWGGVALLAFLFTRNFTAKRTGIILVIPAALITLFFFGGLDLLWTRVLYGWYWPGQEYEKIVKDWFLPINYRSNIHSFSYAPQHFIPAGLCALLLAQLRRQPRFLAMSGIPLAASLFWSPLAALGLLLLTAAAFIENGIRPFLRWQNLLLAPPLAALILAYLSSGELAATREWVWERYEWGHLARWMPLFYIMEFLTLSGLLWSLQTRIRRDVFFIAAVVTLFIAPAYHWGYSKSEVMRHTPIPALIALCWYSVRSVVDNLFRCRSTRTHARRGVHNYRRIILASLVVVVLGISVGGPLRGRIQDTVSEAMHGPLQVFRYNRMLHSTLINIPQYIHHQYAAYDVPFPLDVLLRDAEDARQNRQKGQLIIQSDYYDVYLDQDTLVYMKESCSQEDATTAFFLRIYPVDVSDLRGRHRRVGYENISFGFNPGWIRVGGRCMAIRPLPQYDIRRIVTGQTDGKWEGEFAIRK